MFIELIAEDGIDTAYKVVATAIGKMIYISTYRQCRFL